MGGLISDSRGFGAHETLSTCISDYCRFLHQQYSASHVTARSKSTCFSCSWCHGVALCLTFGNFGTKYKCKKKKTTNKAALVLCNHKGGLMNSVRVQPPHPDTHTQHTHTLTNRHKCCHSSSPLSLIIGGWGTRCKSASVRMCVCALTDSLAWWKMLTFNVLFLLFS